MARSDDASALRDVLGTLLDNGGTVFDTAPGYGASEEVAGQFIGELDARDKVFWATKLNVAGRGGGSADPERARVQLADSFNYIDKDPIDLIQVHNLGILPHSCRSCVSSRKRAASVISVPRIPGATTW